LVRRAAWFAAGLLAFGAAFELTARLEDLIRYGMPLASPYGSEVDLVVHDSLGVHGRPGARYLKWSLNALGTRGPEVTPQPGPGVLRVVATGASETFGQSEAPGLEYPRQLEDSLRATLTGGPAAPYGSVEVLNAAFFGMSLPTATQDVRLRVARFRPAVVVLYPTSVQYLSDARPKAEAPVAQAVPLPGLAATLRPRTLMRLREELKRIAPHAWRDWLWQEQVRRQLARREPGWRYTELPLDRLAAYEADLRAFVGTVRSIGAEPVLATHANRFVGSAVADSSLLNAWQRFYPRPEGKVILAFDSAGAEVTRRVAGDSGVALADVRAALAGCPACFADYAHFTDLGAARVAGAMAAAVERAASKLPSHPVAAQVARDQH
jgi:hypothetical protein